MKSIIITKKPIPQNKIVIIIMLNFVLDVENL